MDTNTVTIFGITMTATEWSAWGSFATFGSAVIMLWSVLVMKRSSKESTKQLEKQIQISASSVEEMKKQSSLSVIADLKKELIYITEELDRCREEFEKNKGSHEYQYMNRMNIYPSEIKQHVQLIDQLLDLFDRLGYLVLNDYIDEEFAKNSFKFHLNYSYKTYYNNRKISKCNSNNIETLYNKWK